MPKSVWPGPQWPEALQMCADTAEEGRNGEESPRAEAQDRSESLCSGSQCVSCWLCAHGMVPHLPEPLLQCLNSREVMEREEHSVQKHLAWAWHSGRGQQTLSPLTACPLLCRFRLPSSTPSLLAPLYSSLLLPLFSLSTPFLETSLQRLCRAGEPLQGVPLCTGHPAES